jgi:selenide, water dikinase
MNIIKAIPKQDISNVLLGFDTWDDAGVILINEELAVIQNIDVISPVSDDAFEFGQIAAANALSDIYAKGGRPLSAMDILCIPRDIEREIASGILEGAVSKLSEAGVALVGGHSVESAEPKFGLAIVGMIRPGNLIRNSTCQPGDKLILTKAIGTGIIVSANKRGHPSLDEYLSNAITIMSELNEQAAEEMLALGANACTDVSGFGLLGHLKLMVRASGVGARILYNNISILPGAEELAAKGIFSSAVSRNRDYAEQDTEGVQYDNALTSEPHRIAVLFDPQTSGGLLISISNENAQELVARLRRAGIRHASIIGEITKSSTSRIQITMD